MVQVTNLDYLAALQMHRIQNQVRHPSLDPGSGVCPIMVANERHWSDGSRKSQLSCDLVASGDQLLRPICGVPIRIDTGRDVLLRLATA